MLIEGSDIRSYVHEHARERDGAGRKLDWPKLLEGGSD